MSILSEKIPVIFISRTHLRAVSVALEEESIVTAIADVEWTTDTLSRILSDLHEKIGDDIRVVVGEDLAYVARFSQKVGVKSDRLGVQRLAAGLIPENLNETAWDFKDIDSVSGDASEKDVQVAVVSKFFSQTIAPVFAGAGFTVNALETESCALARSISDRIDPTLVLHTEYGSNLSVAVDHGTVAATELYDEPLSPDHIETLAASIRKNSFLPISSVIISAKSAEALPDMKAALEAKGFSVQVLPLDPVIGIARKSDISGDDEAILNVNIVPQETRALGFFQNKKHTIIAALLLFLLTIFSVFALLYFDHSSSSTNVSQEIPLPETDTNETNDAVTVAPEEPADTSSNPPADAVSSEPYHLRILNGSGRKGEAARMKGALRNPEQFVIGIGNADADDYEKTVVRSKPSVPQDLILEISTSLSDSYALEENETLDEGEEDDIIIIVGLQKNE